MPRKTATPQPKQKRGKGTTPAPRRTKKGPRAPRPEPEVSPLTSAAQTFLDKLQACSAQEQKFVLAKLDGLSNTEAAKKADYSPRTAKEQGSRLLTRVHVDEAIKAGWVARGITPQSILAGIQEMVEFDPDDVMSCVNEVVTDWEEVLASTVLADVRLELEVVEEMLRNLPPAPRKRRGEKEPEPDPYEVERGVLEAEVVRLRKRETQLAVQVRKNPDALVMEQRSRLRPVPFVDLDKVRQAGKSKFITNVKNTAHGRTIEMLSRKDVLDMGGRALGMFREHHILSGPNGGPIESKATVDYDSLSPERIAEEYAKLLGQADES